MAVPSALMGPGNIAASVGVPGAPNAAGGILRRPGQMPGNIGMTRPAAPPQKLSPQQALAGMTPQTKQALRGIPQSTWQQLSSAGLIHPALMQHLSGQA